MFGLVGAPVDCRSILVNLTVQGDLREAIVGKHKIIEWHNSFVGFFVDEDTAEQVMTDVRDVCQNRDEPAARLDDIVAVFILIQGYAWNFLHAHKWRKGKLFDA